MAQTNVDVIINAKDNASAVLNNVGKTAEQVGSNMISSFDKAVQGSYLFAGALSSIGAVATGALGFGVKFAADIETMTQGFVTLLGSTDKANQAIEMIKRDAAKTPFELKGLISANQLLTSVTKDANQSERFILNIGKALTAMGKGQPELDRVIVNLQQVGAIGHASMVDLKQFAYAGIPIFDMLANEIKGTGKNLEDMVSGGEVTFKMLEDMFNKAGEGTGQFSQSFVLQGGTFNQVLSNFRDNIGITMSEIAKQTGVFDLVKGALQGLTATLGQIASPAGTAKIMEFFDFLKANSPIIAGVIIGGLTPAFIGLAGSIWAAFAPLIPFLATGALIGVSVKLLIDSFGGWNNVMIALQPTLNVLYKMFHDYIKPALSDLWSALTGKLIPALTGLWNVISPVVIPVLKTLADVLAGVVFLAILGTIEIVKQTIIEFSKWVEETGNSAKAIIGFFSSLPGQIDSALSGLANILTKPFKDAWNMIEPILKQVREGLERINPFHRESPSLVDNVMAGVSKIKDEYASLKNISLPPLIQYPLTPQLAYAGNQTSGFRSQNENRSYLANNTTVNLNVSVGLYAGSEIEKRNIAKELYTSLTHLAKSQNKSVSEMFDS